jgi:hypothetical protein
MEAEAESHAHFKFPPKEELISVVTDLSKPIAQRMRSIFYLRTLGGDDAVEALCKGERHTGALAVRRVGGKAEPMTALCCSPGQRRCGRAPQAAATRALPLSCYHACRAAVPEPLPCGPLGW